MTETWAANHRPQEDPRLSLNMIHPTTFLIALPSTSSCFCLFFFFGSNRLRPTCISKLGKSRKGEKNQKQQTEAKQAQMMEQWSEEEEAITSPSQLYSPRLSDTVANELSRQRSASAIVAAPLVHLEESTSCALYQSLFLPPHTLTPSHPHTLTPSHPHTLTPSLALALFCLDFHTGSGVQPEVQQQQAGVWDGPRLCLGSMSCESRKGEGRRVDWFSSDSSHTNAFRVCARVSVCFCAIFHP